MKRDFTYRLVIFILIYWRTFILIGVPILLSPILFVYGDMVGMRTLFVVTTMMAYWVSRAIPLQATSLIPVALFPLLGILNTNLTVRQYLNPVNFVFVGSIITAMAFEESKLHKRIALLLMRLVTCHPRKLHLAVMLLSMFISMWITNAGATVIVCPIIDAILDELDINEVCSYYERPAKLQRPQEFEDLEDEECEELSQTFRARYRGKSWIELIRFRRKSSIVRVRQSRGKPGTMSKVAISFFLGGLYSTSIGGVGTTMGTTSNLSFLKLYKKEFPDAPPLNEFMWMYLHIPIMLLTTLVTWFWLEFYFMGLLRWNSPEAIEVSLGTESATILDKNLYLKSQQLGAPSWREIVVGAIFLLGFLLMLFRKPSFMTGWAELITTSKVDDGTIVILTTLILFIVPLKLGGKITNGRMHGPIAIITWKTVLAKFPWGLLFIVGSGYALGEGSIKSGMDKHMSVFVTTMAENSPSIIIYISSCIISIVLTQFITNSTVNLIMLPIYAKIARVIRCHPLYLMIPNATCASYAFCMELSTPGNAMLMSYCNLPGSAMFKAGLGAALLCLIVELVAFLLWTGVVIDFSTTPTWL